jgi:hypothetical protein
VLGVEAWRTIRYLQAQGVRIRAICRQLGVCRTAVRRALRSDGPSHYQRPACPHQQHSLCGDCFRTVLQTEPSGGQAMHPVKHGRCSWLKWG